MSDKNQILNALAALADEHQLFDKPALEIAKCDMINEGIIDSMSLMQLSALVEEKFKIKIPNATVIKELRTLEDLAGYIAHQQA